MKKASFITLLLMAVSMQSHALNFEQQGAIVVVSGGDIDFPDRGKLIDAIEKGATTLVFRDIGGGRTDVTYTLGRVIKDAGLTTVIDGFCRGSCPTFFMAGKQRRFAHPADPKKPPSMILRGTVIEGTSKAGRSTMQYAYFSEQFGKGMPSDVLNRYTTNGVVDEYLNFSAPSSQYPEGALFNCKSIKGDDGKMSSKCEREEQLTALGVGQITSVEPFVIPGRASAETKVQPNPGSAPTDSKYQITSANLASFTTAREFTTANGAQGVGSAFSLEGKVYAIVSITWPSQQDMGPHEYQTKWYRNGELVAASTPKTGQLKTSPWRFWTNYDGVTLGTGDFKVEAYVDGRLLGTKVFTISDTSAKTPGQAK